MKDLAPCFPLCASVNTLEEEAMDFKYDLKTNFPWNRMTQGIGAVLAAVGVGALIVGGASVAGVLLMAMLVIVGIYFGSIRVLVGSATLATLLKIVGDSIHDIAAVFIPSPQLGQLFAAVSNANYVELIFATFFFFYFVSFGTSCIRLRLFVSETKVNNNAKLKNEEDDGKKAKVING